MTLRPAITTTLFFLGAFVLLPLWMVAARGGANLHSRMQRYHALRISIQSDDPGRLAVADPEADIELIAELLVPGPGRRVRARALHEVWRGHSGWEIYEIGEQRLALSDDGSRATSRYLLKASRERDRLHWDCEDLWLLRDGVWYLDRHREIRKGARRAPPPEPVLP